MKYSGTFYVTSLTKSYSFITTNKVVENVKIRLCITQKTIPLGWTFSSIKYSVFNKENYSPINQMLNQ